MVDEEVILGLAFINIMLIVHLCKKRNKKKRNRSIWSKNWLTRRHEGKGILNMLNLELKNEDACLYRNFLRLCEEQVENVLSAIENDIKTDDTFFRSAIPARSKLEITLRFLATGESFRSLMYSSRIHESTISKFVPIVCDAIIKRFQPIYLKTPRTACEWEAIATNFNDLWQFPQCLGALDGRHIKFRAPISDGSYYFNYKGTNSLVLLALTDAQYRFTYVNVGVNGRISDAGVFNQSNLLQAMKRNSLNFPDPNNLPGRTEKVPYVIIADDAFPLLPNLIIESTENGGIQFWNFSQSF